MSNKDRFLVEIFLIRGQMLQNAIELEAYIDIFLSKYFTDEKDKQTELLNLILSPRMTFDNKVQVFKYIIDKHFPKILEVMPNHTKDIKALIEWRNQVAHFPIDVSDQAFELFEKDKTIAFVKLKNSSKYGLSARGTISLDGIHSQINLMKEYATVLRQFL